MSEPRGEFMRLGVMVGWLEEEYGIRPSQTRKLIEEKVIVGAPLEGRVKAATGNPPSRKATAGAARNGKKKHKGRQRGQLVNYYRKSQIKQGLSL